MISAILLCYNQKRFIKEQFRAILKQDYPGEWEIIISDDFSQDGSFECLEEMVEKEGEGRRIILHRNESNRGIAGNLQCAVHLSRGNGLSSLTAMTSHGKTGSPRWHLWRKNIPVIWFTAILIMKSMKMDNPLMDACCQIQIPSSSNPTGNVFLTFPMFTAVLAEMPCTTGLCSATSNICLQGPALRTIQCCPCAPI
ncbi:hypothetical protein DMI72_06395 [Akkermansia muciniphila]|uniref:glycosyltransferase n=1 Tax=Akkermansia muciniphila TaxID=239935 RepID=UPI00138E6BB9|nr:glycosyltransferase [Akkermansia muciniphila]QHV55860.1 hypothetical protein DMI72_06395 [Akkermansia muciniphila]